MARNPPCRSRPASPSLHVSEERFLEVLQEMSRICGVSDENGSLTLREETALQQYRCGERFSEEQAPSPLLTQLNKNKRKPPRKKGDSATPNKRVKNSAETSFHKSGRGSPVSNSSFDSSASDLYSTSIQTPRSDPSPEEAGMLCDINIPIEAVLQENWMVSPVEAVQSCPSPAPPSTPPSLREQRRRYQHHLNLSMARSDWQTLNREACNGTQKRLEVEAACMELLQRYQQALSVHPPINPATCMAGGLKTDPLLVATRLLTQSLARLRVFLCSLDCMYWLPWADRYHLYRSNICSLAILRASVGLDLGSMPVAYPLPYGEYLAETEALQLLTAHDLYNELRNLIASIQCLGIREFPVMLLVMMAAFFRECETDKRKDVGWEKIGKIHNYYNTKLQMYLCLRFGSAMSYSMLHNIYLTIDKIKNFSDRLKVFLGEVTQVGLQRQYEPVCENLGLMAYLMQCEPCMDC